MLPIPIPPHNVVARLCDLADKLDSPDHDDIKEETIEEIEELILSIYYS